MAGRRLAVIEDVVSSGGQLIESCAALRERGGEIGALMCVIDRETGGADNLAAEGLALRSVFTMSCAKQPALRLQVLLARFLAAVAPAALPKPAMAVPG